MERNSECFSAELWTQCEILLLLEQLRKPCKISAGLFSEKDHFPYVCFNYSILNFLSTNQVKINCVAILLPRFLMVDSSLFKIRLCLKSFFLEMSFNPHCTQMPSLKWCNHLWNEGMFVETLFCSRFLSSFFRKWCTKKLLMTTCEKLKFPALICLLSGVIKNSIVLDKDKLRMTCKIK